jgi:hypothetical protein
MAPVDVVREFVTDIEAVHGKGALALKDEWPDLHLTYEKATKLLVDPHLEARTMLNDLLEWAARMGGFDSPVWMRARVFRDRLLPEG